MKIICVDNFNREIYSDRLICENIHEITGKEVVEFLNNKYSGESSADYYKLVPDDYKLFERDY